MNSACRIFFQVVDFISRNSLTNWPLTIAAKYGRGWTCILQMGEIEYSRENTFGGIP